MSGAGDTVFAMALPHGGHLTHGSKVNFSGRWFDVVAYGVRRDTELIDYDEVRELALRHRPKMIICGATAYPRLIDFPVFRGIADEVGAWLGTPCVTTQGMGPHEMKEIGSLMAQAVGTPGPPEEVRERVTAITAAHLPYAREL